MTAPPCRTSRSPAAPARSRSSRSTTVTTTPGPTTFGPQGVAGARRGRRRACGPAPRPGRSRPSASPASPSSSRSAPTCRRRPLVDPPRPGHLEVARAGHAAFAAIMDLPVPDLRVRQRCRHGRRRRDRARVRPPHDLGRRRGLRAARDLPRSRAGLGWLLPPAPARRASRRAHGHRREPVVAEPDAQAQGRRPASASPTCSSSPPTSSRTRCAGPPACSPAPSRCSAPRSTVTRRRGTPPATPRAQGGARQDGRSGPRCAARRRAGRAARTASRDEAFAARTRRSRLVMGDELRAPPRTRRSATSS